MSQQYMISAQKVEQLIAQGKPVVIHEGYALNISKWIDSHPGGRLAILHMVGRDATDEINMYAILYRPELTRLHVTYKNHRTDSTCRSYHSNKALLMMKKYRIGRVQSPWTNFEPPIRAAKPTSRSECNEKAAMKAADDRRSRRSVDLTSVSPPSDTSFANMVLSIALLCILTPRSRSPLQSARS